MDEKSLIVGESYWVALPTACISRGLTGLKGPFKWQSSGKKYLGFVFVGRYFSITRPVSIFKIFILTIVGGKKLVETCVNFTRAGAVFILALYTLLIPSPSLSGKLQYYLSILEGTKWCLCQWYFKCCNSHQSLFRNIISLHFNLWQRGRVVSASDSQSGGPEFDSSSATCWVCSQSSRVHILSHACK